MATGHGLDMVVESMMKVPTYLRSLRGVNYWFARHHVYGTYSGSLAPVDVHHFHIQKSREDWEPWREKALTAHGMDVTPNLDPDDPVGTIPTAEALSTKPIPYFLCIDCESRRQTQPTSNLSD